MAQESSLVADRGRSRMHRRCLFEQALDVGEVVEGELQLLHRLGDQFLGLGQVVGVVELPRRGAT